MSEPNGIVIDMAYSDWIKTPEAETCFYVDHFAAGYKARDSEIEELGKKLNKAKEHARYYLGISECECSSPHPIGSCMYCDMKEILDGEEA